MGALKKQIKKVNADVNLAPLMDVLTCTVGVMLFVVIFVVLEAKSQTFTLSAPFQKGEPPKNSLRNLFFCKNGKIKFFDIKRADDSLFYKADVSFDNVPDIVAAANKRNVSDSFYKFAFDYTESTSLFGQRQRRFIINVTELNPEGGEGSADLDSAKSQIGKMLAHLDPKRNWVALALADEESIAVFRKARKIANCAGIPNGWDPVKLSFPLAVPVGSGDGCPFCP